MSKIFIGYDHNGLDLKIKIIKYLQDNSYEVFDVGSPPTLDPKKCDYPIFGAKVGQLVIDNIGSKGILICGSGIGIGIAANKIKGIKCATVNTMNLAKTAREHNGINILSIGANTHNFDDPIDIISIFLNTKEDLADRHKRRRTLLDNL